MTKLFIPLVSLASVLALAPTAQAQSFPNHIYNATSALAKCLGVSPNTDNTKLDANACHGYPGSDLDHPSITPAWLSAGPQAVAATSP